MTDLENIKMMSSARVKVYILLSSKNENIGLKKFSIGGMNPGVGGTELTVIRLALKLSTISPNWEIILVNNSIVDIVDSPSNLKQTCFDTPQDFFQYLTPGSPSVIVATVSVLKNVPIFLLQQSSQCLIAWSHHPFDRDLKSMATLVKFRAIVCSGVYQYYSNLVSDFRLLHIQDMFILPTPINNNEKKPLDENQVNIVYLGALIPAKGFLEVAKTWEKLKEKFPKIRIHVIGSSATYGNESESKLVPTDLDYATKILKFIPEEDIYDGNVIFYGNLGVEKFNIIEKCDLAILNPTGQSESFPASPLEIMALGVPVIASDDYGMSDCMRYFPELKINGFQDIPNKVEYLVQDPLRYQELQQRSVAVAQWFSSQNAQIIIRWLRLLDDVFENENLQLPPVAPFYGSRLKLWFRRDIRPKLKDLKSNVQRILALPV